MIQTWRLYCILYYGSALIKSTCSLGCLVWHLNCRSLTTIIVDTIGMWSLPLSTHRKPFTCRMEFPKRLLIVMQCILFLTPPPGPFYVYNCLLWSLNHVVIITSSFDEHHSIHGSSLSFPSPKPWAPTTSLMEHVHSLYNVWISFFTN